MDTQTAILLSAIIAGIFTILVEVVKKRLERLPTGKGKGIGKSKTLCKKFWDLPILQRTIILCLAFTTLILALLYHTGIIPVKMGVFGNTLCPGRQNIQSNSDIDVKVTTGYIAYYMGWQFDGKDGGFFVTFKGPYKGTHKLGNGVYCPPIPADTELSQKTFDILKRECQGSSGGCPKEITCTQNLFKYHFDEGECHE